MKSLVPLVLLVVALAACGGAQGAVPHSSGPPAPSAAASSSPPATAATAAPTAAPQALQAVTPADLDAMARRIFPGAHPAGCGDIAACPVTDRLRTRVAQLSQPTGGPGSVVQFCRCQNGAESMTVLSEVRPSGGTAHVTLTYGPQATSKLDLVFLEEPDRRLLLDDTQCTGRGASTSIYAPTLAACQA